MGQDQSNPLSCICLPCKKIMNKNNEIKPVKKIRKGGMGSFRTNNLNLENIEGLDIEAMERAAGAANLQKNLDVDNPFKIVDQKQQNELKSGVPDGMNSPPITPATAADDIVDDQNTGESPIIKKNMPFEIDSQNNDPNIMVEVQAHSIPQPFSGTADTIPAAMTEGKILGDKPGFQMVYLATNVEYDFERDTVFSLILGPLVAKCFNKDPERTMVQINSGMKPWLQDVEGEYAALRIQISGGNVETENDQVKEMISQKVAEQLNIKEKQVFIELYNVDSQLSGLKGQTLDQS